VIVQIYEIQTPEEAEAAVAAGVDHVGSVVFAPDAPGDDRLGEVIRTVRAAGAISSLIPLFDDTDAVSRTLDRFEPDIVHFCDLIPTDAGAVLDRCVALQAKVRSRFPQIAIMRSIPIAPAGGGDARSVLALADRLAGVSDWFLTDTVLGDGTAINGQPVAGYVGITGQPCNWEIARQLVVHSPIPVILAGGLSPENVADGVRQVRPAGVDSCTLTNAVDTDGHPIRFQKDMTRVARFASCARDAAALTADPNSRN